MPRFRASAGDPYRISSPFNVIVPASQDQRTRQGLDEAGFSGPVVADDRQHFAGKQIEIGAANSGDVSIPLDKAPSRQHGIGVGTDGWTGCVGRSDHDILRRVSWSKATAAMTRTPVARF